MPLVNASGDPELDYLSDGITEAILNTVSQLPRLRVVPRSTVFRFKGRESEPIGAGRQLGVRAVLTGRVMKRDGALVISAELTDVFHESQLWGGRYSRKLDDIFEVQDELAHRICDTIRPQLVPRHKSHVSKRQTHNRAAYEFLLRAQYHVTEYTAESLRLGIDYARRAIEKDPTYASAYALLAFAYTSLGYFGFLCPSEAYPKAKAAAVRALGIDYNLAEAHTVLGIANSYCDRNICASEGE